jgi:dihydroorotase
MEHDLVLEGRVVGPEGLSDTEVGVSEGVIAEIGHGLRGGRRIKTGRSLIFPGFVDIHVHLREPGWEHKEDFRTGTLAAVHGGVTTVADMPNNPSPIMSAEALRPKMLLASRKAIVNVRLFGGVALDNLERLGGMAQDVAGYKVYLSETTGTRAFPESELPRAFEAIAKTGRPASLHCEKQSVIEQRREQLRGSGRPDLHADVRPPEAEVEAVSGAIAAMKMSPGLRANVCHASTGRAVGLVRKARVEGVKVDCEAALHHIYFNRRALLENRLLRTNPPLRSEDDRQALLEGIRDGGVSFLVTDHAPHLESEKEEGLAGVPGLDDYGHLVSWLLREQGIYPQLIAKVASHNPARYLRLDDRGEVVLGKKADLTVLDVHSPVKVTKDAVRSKCGWSPYEGREFPGRVRWTVSGGNVLMDDFEIAV